MRISKPDREFAETLRDLKQDPRVQSMKNYCQHGAVSTYSHCNAVAKLSHRLNQRLHLHANPETLLKGAILHDFYLYDWHTPGDGSHRWHGFFQRPAADDTAALTGDDVIDGRGDVLVTCADGYDVV